MSYSVRKEPDDGTVPDVIPEELPEGVLLALVVMAPEVMGIPSDLTPGQQLAGGLQMRVNGPLDAVIVALSAALGVLRAELEQEAERN